jgi:hypothetical protein
VNGKLREGIGRSIMKMGKSRKAIVRQRKRIVKRSIYKGR